MAKGAEAKVTFKAFNQDYKKKIDENVAAGKGLKQDLKLTQEQMKFTGTSVEKLTVTLDSLEDQYKLQKSTTQETRNQLELVKKQFGENSVEAGKLEAALKKNEIAEQQLANKITQTSFALEKAESANDGYIAKSKQLEQEQNDLQLSADKLASEYKLLQETTLKTADESEKFAAAQKYVAEQAELSERKIDSMERQLSEVKKEYGENSNEAKKMEIQVNEAKIAFSNLEAEANQLTDGLGETGDSMQSLGDKLDASNLMAAADALSGIGEKLKEFGRSAQEAFLEVDEGADIIITKTGATGEAADRMAESYKKITNSMPVDSFADVGSAIGEMNTQFGFTDDQLEKTSEYLLKFANINDTDVSESAINARKVIEAFELSYDDFNQVLDTTTKVAQNSGVSVDKLFEAAVKGAPQIKALGLEFDEGIQLLGQMEQAGISSAETLTGLTKASVNYAKENKTLSQGLGELQDKILNASSETEALNAAAEIFGTKNGEKMADAIRRGALNLEDLSSIAVESAGVVEETFLNTQDPIDAQVLAMQNVKNMMAELGNELAIVFEPILLALIPILQSLSAWFGNLPEPVKSFVVILGVLIVIFTTMMPIMAAMVVSIGILASPWLLVVIAVMAVIAILIYLYAKFEWFRDGVNLFFIFIKDIFVSGFTFMGGYVESQFEAILKNFTNFYEAGKRILNGLMDFFTGVFTGNWSKAWKGLSNIVGGILDGLSAVVKTPLNTMIGIVNGFIGGINSIKIPSWIPKIGGKNASIPKIPLLAKGGSFFNGSAIVGEAGPELISTVAGKTTVQPLSQKEKSGGILSAMLKMFEGGGNIPLLSGLTEAATNKITAINNNQNSNNRLEYLLEMLIEVVQEKNMIVQVPGGSGSSLTGFDRFDTPNKEMAAAEMIRKLGVR